VRALRTLVTRRDVDRRVPEAQAQARQGLALCLAFAAAAAVVVVADGDRWSAVHLFVAGGLVSAFGGVSVLLAATWSAAPAPAPALGLAQRLAVALGAAGVVAGRELADSPGLTGAFGTVYALGLLGLAALLVDVVRHGSKRRFDPAVTGWAAGLVLAVLGTTAGVALASGRAEVDLRAVHLTTNLLGFLGFVIATTIPFFGSTVVRAKMNPWATPLAVNATTGLLGGGALLAVLGLASERAPLVRAGLVVHLLGVVATYAISPRPTARQLDWAGPRLVGLWAGGAWWLVAVGAAAVGGPAADPLGDRWYVVLVVGGYLQILWASLAYLLPMLRGGGHELLGRGFAATRSWVALAALQVAAGAAVARSGTVLRAALAVVVLDTAGRVLRVGAGRPAERPDAAG